MKILISLLLMATIWKPSASAIWENLLNSSHQLESAQNSSEAQPSGGLLLPIPWFTKKFFKEAGGMMQDSATYLLNTIQMRLDRFPEERPVVLKDDTSFYQLCLNFHSVPIIKTSRENQHWEVMQETGVFIRDIPTWFRYWKTQTNIDLDTTYRQQIKSHDFQRIFPLFLVYIEMITMILPKRSETEMEVDVEARCQWFVQAANADHNLADLQQDPALRELGEYFSRLEDPRYTYETINERVWEFIVVWARKFRPSILAQGMTGTKGGRFEMATPVKGFIDAVFATTIASLTHECVAATERLINDLARPQTLLASHQRASSVSSDSVDWMENL
ncbi:hypothetical protein PCANC_03265 [Puccinia coronata f. sp. avenae]|uniref:Uncharacterized protein n=2 Tax=Puccinia coronata f. sp. avenae TaxID=200324 RepID=A0A2N5VZ45_9BASI|nr:hypothetical protein PCANC_03265 [Puccinia coronata f. sp. avenae]